MLCVGYPDLVSHYGIFHIGYEQNEQVVSAVNVERGAIPAKSQKYCYITVLSNMAPNCISKSGVTHFFGWQVAALIPGDLDKGDVCHIRHSHETSEIWPV